MITWVHTCKNIHMHACTPYTHRLASIHTYNTHMHSYIHRLASMHMGYSHTYMHAHISGLL